MNISDKKNLERNHFRKLRDKGSDDLRNKVVINVKIYLETFLKKNQNLDYIGIFWPLKNEIDIRSLKDKYSLALPRCEAKKRLSFYSWDDNFLTKDYEGILSPRKNKLITYKQMSILFVPCLSMDKNFIRLGYGGGYFDKLREDKNWREIPCIGLLTSDCVSKTSLTRATWDIPLSGLITEKEILV